MTTKHDHPCQSDTDEELAARLRRAVEEVNRVSAEAQGRKMIVNIDTTAIYQIGDAPGRKILGVKITREI